MSETQDASQWNFYPCQLDDAPASIMLNMEYADEHPKLDTFYYAGLQIMEPLNHGMGSMEEAELLGGVSDVIAESAAVLGLLFVGRIRNLGDWQLCFYGNVGKDQALQDLVVDALPGGRGYRLGNKADPNWDYYNETLLPDAERWAWMMDRGVVQQLAAGGDKSDVPREVDHHIEFPSVDARSAFLKASEVASFRTSGMEPDPDDDTRFAVSLHRDDPVQLEHIHQVAMTLRVLAAQHGGEYDGWGCVLISE